MTEVILKGPKALQLDLGEGFKDAGVSVNLSTKELAKAQKEGLIECYVENGRPAKSAPKTKKPTTVQKKTTYTKNELVALNKAEQVAILENLGLNPASTEPKRVTQILEATK